MDKETLIKAIKIISEQEEKLQFDHFNEDDAWDFGCFMVKKMKENNCPMAVAIRKLNGSTVFQYLPAGTAAHHALWMDKKFNTVCMRETSSIKFGVELNLIECTLEQQRMPVEDFAACGGAFPIRVKGTGIVMVLTASRLPHEQDHAFMVNCLSEYLGVEVPALDFQVPMGE